MTTFNAQDQRQRRTLLLVLVLNFGLFLALGVAGWLADSSALLANAADNASDSAVYLISFLAVGRAPRWKKTAATLSGILLLLFAMGVLTDVGRRWLMGTEPIGPTMMVMAFAASLVNLWCLKLLKKVDSDDVNMRAAETFSFNDFVSNGGILVAGGLVMWLGQAWPDLIVGTLVAIVAAKGAFEILRDVRNEPS